MSNKLCTHPKKFYSALFTRCTTLNDSYANSPPAVQHSEVNGIFLHTLYGPVQLHGGVRRTSPTGCVHFLGSPVVSYTLGV